MEQSIKKVASNDTSFVTQLYISIVLIGGIADLILLGNTLHDADIASSIASILPSNYQVIGAFITCYSLGFIICTLASAVMFKAGSILIKPMPFTKYLFIAVWLVLGILLLLFRATSELKIHTQSGAKENPQTNIEIILAIILFVLYIMTGLSSYFLGESLGNIVLSKYNKIEKLLKGELRNELMDNYENLIETHAKLNQMVLSIEEETKNFNNKMKNVESSILAQIKNSNTKVKEYKSKENNNGK